MAIEASKQKEIWGRRQKETLWKQVASSAWNVRNFHALLKYSFCSEASLEDDVSLPGEWWGHFVFRILRLHKETLACFTHAATMKFSGNQEEAYVSIPKSQTAGLDFTFATTSKVSLSPHVNRPGHWVHRKQVGELIVLTIMHKD